MADKKIPAVGTKLMVFRGLATHTPGNLYKKDLMRHKGRIISRKKHAQGKKAIKHLKNLGYIAKKGTFKLFRKSMVDGRKHKGKRHTRKRGGFAEGVTAKLSTGTGQPGGTGSGQMQGTK